MKTNKLIHGIDVTNPSRVEFKNPKLYLKVLHRNEILTWKQLKNTEQNLYLAKRWTIKEALFKALPTPTPLNQMEIYCDAHHYFYEHYDYEFSISLSYENELIYASVVGLLKTILN